MIFRPPPKHTPGIHASCLLMTDEEVFLKNVLELYEGKSAVCRTGINTEARLQRINSDAFHSLLVIRASKTVKIKTIFSVMVSPRRVI